jgi:hypothetical protein
MAIGIFITTVGLWIAFLGARHRVVARGRLENAQARPRARFISAKGRAGEARRT